MERASEHADQKRWDGRQSHYLLVHDDIDLDASFGAALEDFVQAPVLSVCRGSSEELWRGC